MSTRTDRKYAIGDRVIIQNFHRDIDGLAGEVVAYPSVYPYRVRLDNDPGSFFDDGRLFDEDELTPEPIKIADTYPFQPGDRVVYTPPETFSGRPGTYAAEPGLTGEQGTVVKQTYSASVLVDWDNARRLNNSVEFVQPYVEPTHARPEGLYRDKHNPDYYVFVRHEDEPGKYMFVYPLDARDESASVNRHMSDNLFRSYELVTATS